MSIYPSATFLFQFGVNIQLSLRRTLGTLRSNDATATRTSLKKCIFVLSVFIAIIPTHLLCQLQANPPKAEFQGTIFKLRKRNKISSLLVYVLHKTRNQALSRRSRAKTGKKCTKKCDVRAKLLFCLLKLLFVDVLVAVRVVESVKSLLSLVEAQLFKR